MSRSYCFTIFNEWAPIEHDTSGKILKYLIAGKEIAPSTGNKHWQCYAQFSRAVRITQATKLINGDGKKFKMLECNGTAEENINYCKGLVAKKNFQPNEVYEWGTSTSQGKRTDIESLIEDIRSGKSKDEIRDLYPRQWFLYRKKIEDEFNYIESKQDEIERSENLLMPYDYQEEIIEIIKNQTNRRNIYIFVDELGGWGKSTVLAEHIVTKMNGIVFDTLDKINCAYAYNRQKYVIFDIPRAHEWKKSDYEAIESFTNPTVFSTKYEPKTKILKCIVLVFTNNDLDIRQFSKDRPKVLYLKKRNEVD